MKPKEVIETLLRNAHSEAQDNLCRAKRMFDPAQQNMNAQYGQSGRTCQEVLDGYQRENDDILEAIAWLRNIS